MSNDLKMWEEEGETMDVEMQEYIRKEFMQYEISNSLATFELEAYTSSFIFFSFNEYVTIGI